MKLKALVRSAALVSAALYMIAPEKPDDYKKAPFMGRNFAHRGLHTPDRSVPENSLPAFKAAAAMGYGVELDVHITADDKIVVFHDSSLLRMCGDDKIIENLKYEELKGYRLAGTEYGIPTLEEVFDVLGGVPVILELKNGPRNNKLCRLTLDIIRTYTGPVCIESFNPLIVAWFRRHAPELLRGQLAAPAKNLKDGAGGAGALAISSLILNAAARPNFLAWRIGKKTPSASLCEAMGAMKVAWTSHDDSNEEKNDAVIFEYYLPEVRFK